MSPTLQQLGIDRLSACERLALAQEIIDSVITEQVPAPGQLSEAKRRELRRRLDDCREHPEDGIPWEQIKAESIARWGE